MFVRYVLSFKRLEKILREIQKKQSSNEKQQCSHGCQVKACVLKRAVFLLTMEVLTSTSTVLEAGPKKVDLSSLSFLSLEELRLQSLRLFFIRKNQHLLEKSNYNSRQKEEKIWCTVFIAAATIGTRIEYFLGYLQYVINSLSKNDLKGHYIAMNSSYL